MSQDTNLKSKYEASLLEKYKDMFPNAFIECVKNGVTWLANHNGITYQTSALISTDNIVYEANKSSILKIGLINVDKPLSGMQYYSVRSMKEEKDSISGNTIFKVKLDYTAPVGIEIMMIPITYFSPYTEDGGSMFYTKEEVVGLIQSMKQNVELEVSKQLELVKQESKAYADNIFGSMEDLDFDFGVKEGEAPNSISTKPIQKIVEHLHSVSMNLSELGKESNINKTSITDIQNAIKQLQVQIDSGVVAAPELPPVVSELPPYYTKDEVDSILTTKVDSYTFEQYVIEAEQKFCNKVSSSVEVQDEKQPSGQPPVTTPVTEEELPSNIKAEEEAQPNEVEVELKKEEELVVPPVVNTEDVKQAVNSADIEVSKDDQESVVKPVENEEAVGQAPEVEKEQVGPEVTDVSSPSPVEVVSPSTLPEASAPVAEQEQPVSVPGEVQQAPGAEAEAGSPQQDVSVNQDSEREDTGKVVSQELPVESQPLPVGEAESRNEEETRS